MIGDSGRFVIADIPGLIPGAHEGKGLGLRFLQHVERTSILAQLIDVGSTLIEQHGAANFDELEDKDLLRAAADQFLSLDDELRKFSEDLARKPRVIVFSKGDQPVSARAYDAAKGWFVERGFSVYLISSHTGLGLEELKQALQALVKARAE